MQGAPQSVTLVLLPPVAAVPKPDPLSPSTTPPPKPPVVGVKAPLTPEPRMLKKAAPRARPTKGSASKTRCVPAGTGPTVQVTEVALQAVMAHGAPPMVTAAPVGCALPKAVPVSTREAPTAADTGDTEARKGVELVGK